MIAFALLATIAVAPAPDSRAAVIAYCRTRYSQSRCTCTIDHLLTASDGPALIDVIAVVLRNGGDDVDKEKAAQAELRRRGLTEAQVDEMMARVTRETAMYAGTCADKPAADGR